MSTQTVSAVGCEEMMDCFRPYLEGELEPEAAVGLLGHLKSCQNCKKEFDAQKQVIAMLGQTYAARKISAHFDAKADKKLILRRQTPNAELQPIAARAADIDDAFMTDPENLQS